MAACSTCGFERALREGDSARDDETSSALEQDLERYERKGILVPAQHPRTRLAQLRDVAPR
jgi:hypothetical protein